MSYNVEVLGGTLAEGVDFAEAQVTAKKTLALGRRVNITNPLTSDKPCRMWNHALPDSGGEVAEVKKSTVSYRPDYFQPRKMRRVMGWE